MAPLEKFVLHELQQGKKTTFDLRNKGVCSTAQTISCLKRKYGLMILTERCSCRDAAGVMHHNIARYHLLPDITKNDSIHQDQFFHPTKVVCNHIQRRLI
ncbi:hypothetical protein [Conchiformibius kuhniae]|uniref:Uncharacterized protein n=1 Tax=Conchiformibius kuhniae TaxID=211502 RepID=A0A8T9MS02_9NEIS|nr:hypothetical protein [Conchiformibius kuhniae]UOP04680.1 hypothetical protein LVJ77_10870 [Conchiformibius kuhniae]